MRPGTVDEAPALTTSRKADIIANAANKARVRLDAAYGGKGDLQTLSRLVNVSMEGLVFLYDAIMEQSK